MGAVKNLLTDPGALFYLADLSHETKDVVLVVHDELMDYICEESDTVCYDNVDRIQLVSYGELSGGAFIRMDEMFALTVDFIREECDKAKA